jgi:hypothetical protein
MKNYIGTDGLEYDWRTGRPIIKDASKFWGTGQYANEADSKVNDETGLSNNEAFADLKEDDIDLDEEIESDHLYAEEHKDINDYHTKRKSRLEKEKKEKIGDIKPKKLGKGNKITKPTPPGILRYPYEGMTQHTDYLQIDIVEYKPVGREKTKDKTVKVPIKQIEGVEHDLFEKKIVKGQGAKFKGKMGGRRNSLNRSVGRTRSYALSRRPLKNEGTILLPIPSNVQDGNSIKVGENSLNGLQAAGASGIMDAMTPDLKKVQGVKDAAGKIATGLADAATNFSNQTKAGATLDDIKSVALNKLTASALGIFGGNITTNQLLARQRGEIINPNMELLFDAPTIRAFKFQFKMTPRNRREAEQIRLIIRAFKRNMAPKAKGGTEKESAWFLKTPNVFELRYRTGNKDHNYLHKFKQCFLTDIAVNYTGDGVYSTYEDGSPVSYLMDLSFKELEPIYDIDYDNVPANEGVGY